MLPKSSSFAAAALAATTAFARNENNGIDQANAVTTLLLDNEDVSLILHTYNSKNGETLELHGDIELKIKPSSNR